MSKYSTALSSIRRRSVKGELREMRTWVVRESASETKGTDYLTYGEAFGVSVSSFSFSLDDDPGQDRDVCDNGSLERSSSLVPFCLTVPE